MKSTLIIALVASTALAGCTVTPKPLSSASIATTADLNRIAVTADLEPVIAPIGLYDAMARALKYNLDYKIEMMEEALKVRELGLTRFEMLPQLVASGGYAGRSNFAGASSLSLLTRRQSLEPSTSSEKDIFSGELTLSFDVLDFGLSYVRAQQKADEILIAAERRRKVANRIIEDVRTSYWRAVSAERLLGKLTQLETSVAATLGKSEQVSQQRLSSPLTALTYQRELLDIQGDTRRLQRELVVAKAQLAALMNLAPGTRFALVMPERGVAMPLVRADGDNMMVTALRNRAELREVSYRQRINRKDLDAQLLGILPSFKALVGVNTDSNDFLFNNNWSAYGARASFNLLNVFRYPQAKRTNAAQADVLRQRELALTMAVMTQVYVARARHGYLVNELETAGRRYRVQDNILGQIRAGNRAGSMSRQTLLREEMNSLVSEVRYDIAYAEAQNAYANLFAAMGIDDLQPDITGKESVAAISQSLATLWRARENAASF